MGFVSGHIHRADELHSRLSVTAALTAVGAMVLMLSIVACGSGVSSALGTLPPPRAASGIPQAHSGNGASPAPNTTAQASATDNTPLMGGDASFPAPSASARGSASSSRSNGLDGPPAPSGSVPPSSSPTPAANGNLNPSPGCSTTSPASSATTSPATTPPASSPNC